MTVDLKVVAQSLEEGKLLICREQSGREVPPDTLAAVVAALRSFAVPEAALIDGLTGKQWEERAKYIERAYDELRAFVDKAFQAHPNLDIDIQQLPQVEKP